MSDKCLCHIHNYWQEITKISNASFFKEDYNQAIVGYQQALYRAQVLKNYPTRCKELNIPLLQIYVISYNNLAFCYKELNQVEKAQNYLTYVVCYLLYLRSKCLLDAKSFSYELQKAVLTYLEFLQDNKSRLSNPIDILEIINTYLKGR